VIKMNSNQFLIWAVCLFFASIAIVIGKQGEWQPFIAAAFVILAMRKDSHGLDKN